MPIILPIGAAVGVICGLFSFMFGDNTTAQADASYCTTILNNKYNDFNKASHDWLDNNTDTVRGYNVVYADDCSGVNNFQDALLLYIIFSTDNVSSDSSDDSYLVVDSDTEKANLDKAFNMLTYAETSDKTRTVHRKTLADVENSLTANQKKMLELERELVADGSSFDLGERVTGDYADDVGLGSDLIASDLGQAAADYGCKFVGNKYVYGGTDINNGIDCSAFTQYVCGQFGILLPRTSKEQVKSGQAVASLAEAKPGDLIFYSRNGTDEKVYHVTMYIGNGKMVHLLLKVQYLQELSPGRNVIFATGTPISNSIAEMYVMQKYLASDALKERDIYAFDLWASNFGKVETTLELAPEGNRYREKTRFAQFVNTPELITLFRQFADVKTPDMIKLDVPTLKDGKYSIVESEPDDFVKEVMETFVERAEAIHNGNVAPDEDNMLKVCHDGKLLAMDVRLIDPDAVPAPDCKLNKCVENVFKVYNEKDGIQVIFSDIGVPGASDKFSVYDYIKDELVKKGIPSDEICFIHDAKNDKARDVMFEDLRNGTKRIIIGSTQKMGTGTNIQRLMVAMHELDVPWRPADVEQREGRILRQGNLNKEVEIFRYVTKGTFDAYNWNILVNKQHFISQIMNGQVVDREFEDIDKNELSYSEVMAAASGDELIKEKNQVDNDVRKYTMLKRSYDDNHYRLQSDIQTRIPQKIKRGEQILDNLQQDIICRDNSDYKRIFAPKTGDEDIFEWNVNNMTFTGKEDAGQYLIDCSKSVKSGDRQEIGDLCGFKIFIERKFMSDHGADIIIKGANEYKKELSSTAEGNITRIKNALASFEDHVETYTEKVNAEKKNLEVNMKQFAEPFQYEDKLNALLERKREIDLTLLERQKEAKKSENLSVEDDSIDCGKTKNTKKL